MKNSLIRVLISLFLCCCLILNVAAMPARASSFGSWLLHQIGTDIGITGILEGLGLFRDTLNGDEYYNDLVSDVKDHLANTGQVTGEYIDAYWRIDPLNVNPVLTIPLALISAVRNYIFDNGVVYSGPQLPSGVDSSYAEALATAQSKYSYYCTGYNSSGVFFIGAANQELYFYDVGGEQVRAGNSIKYFTYISGEYQWLSMPYINIQGHKDTVKFYQTGVTDNEVSTSYPVSLGVIPPRDTLFNVAYPQWLEHQRELEDGTTETVVQIGLGNTQVETESLTQEQIWSGQGSISVPGQDVTDATLTDILKSIVALPGQMVVSITDALSTFFTPSGTIEAYSLDLKDLFPFCIPFDIYDFLAALSADPVPPVFEFDLNLGVATEPMKIDLSNWSDLAAIIRTLELGLFCVGLALKTRELIGG